MLEIRSSKLILRNLKLTDLDRFYEVYNSKFVMKYNLITKLNKLEIQKLILGEMLNTNSWAIEDVETGLFVGMIHKSKDTLRIAMNTCELSYWLSEDFAGKGYMKEALELIIANLFISEKYDGITCRAFEDNERSNRLLKSLGFEKEGVLYRVAKTEDGKYHNDCLYYLKNKFKKD